MGGPRHQGRLEGGAPGRSRFYAIPPCRLLDTRGPVGPTGGPALAAGASRTFTLAGLCAIPSTARALALNVTVTQPTAAGHLTLHAAGGAVPTASTLNYLAGSVRANNAIRA